MAPTTPNPEQLSEEVRRNDSPEREVPVTPTVDKDGPPATVAEPGALLDWLQNRPRARLELKDGLVFEGFSFGHEGPVAGEVVFNTGMVGYPESLTDPSYAGQILVITFPLVGNYGVPSDERDELGLARFFESDRIHVKAVIVSDYSFTSSHYQASLTLSAWLRSQQVPGIYGVDTRALTKRLRSEGSVLGRVLLDSHAEVAWDDPNSRNLAAEVSRRERTSFSPPPLAARGEGSGDDAGPVRVLAVDCGMKNNIIRYLVNVLRVHLTVVPWDYDFTQDDFDGLFLSNGPGNPEHCGKTIEHVQSLMARCPRKPIFGICLGNQILALAAGASTYKMKYGNRGMNQPCVDLRTARCYITPQNHGFAVDTSSLPADWKPFFINANDGSNEGIIHAQRPWMSVQFHPEANGGPMDTDFLFHHFVGNMSHPHMTAVTTIPFQMPIVRKKVLVLGSGGLTIGQAGEFDYSGSQAIKALREAGAHSVLINPNIATVQTSNGLADRVYFLPVNPEFVTQVIKKERPDGIFCAFGGQTALNCAVRLHDAGVFEEYNVEVLGTPIKSIVMTEDREIFARAVETCGYKVAESACCSTIDEAVDAAAKIGYPVLVRSAFALGGLGSGFAANVGELRELVQAALVNSPQVIVDKSLKGWKELEYEVVRDRNDNCITVCNMENFDPMGIHTGDSIVIAPSQTLTNAEYFRLRECALKVVRHIGVVGECNIQYAVDPKSQEFRIIEVNARLSRSSALASKATGYPLAYVAAKLALGNDLVQLRNSVTRSTTACFEPSLDYVVAKVPRWDLRKFATVDSTVGSCMKSVGEVMAIGRTFEETIQKALRMVDESCTGFDADRFDLELQHRDLPQHVDHVRKELSNPSPTRIWAVAKAFEMGMNIADVHDLTRIDMWFLSKLYNIHVVKESLRTMGLTELRGAPALMREAKRSGFADRQIAASLNVKATENEVRSIRQEVGIRPVVKQIDTLAAEFPADTNYLYLTYSGTEHDLEFREPASGSVPPARRLARQRANSDGDTGVGAFSLPEPTTLPLSRSRTERLASPSNKRVIVLGCGSYRIGSSVEFDWCSVSCIKALRSLGHQAIVINCNPETVSTDFDESDRLYFEELSHESVLDIAELEDPSGVVVSVGGQTPNNLAMGLASAGCKILGTSVEAIDACEDRNKFSQLCDSLRIDQPEWSSFSTLSGASSFCEAVGYPVLVRPSYVLSGAAMRVVPSSTDLEKFLVTAAVVSRDYPVVISKYIRGAKEVEFDAVAQCGEIINYAVAEHVENAGVHSGDATHLLPAQKLFVETHRRVKRVSEKLCRALKISGPFNIQFMCRENEVKVIECNLRASRSMPFISKTYNVNFIELATRVMIGLHVSPSNTVRPIDMEYVACKVPTFSFARLKNSDPRLGVEMQSTGEVACLGANQYEAFLKAMVAAGFRLPAKNVLLSIGPDAQKKEFLPSLKLLEDMGFQLYGTKGSCEVARNDGGIDSCILVHKPHNRREPNARTLLLAGKLDLVINVPDSMDSEGLTDGFDIRRTAVDSNTPLITDIKIAMLTVQALHRKWSRERAGKCFWSLSSWQEHIAELCA